MKKRFPNRSLEENKDPVPGSQYSTERSPDGALLEAAKQVVILPFLQHESCPPPAQGGPEQSVQQE